MSNMVITLKDEVYNKLKEYTNTLPSRSKGKISFSDAVYKLIKFREGN